MKIYTLFKYVAITLMLVGCNSSNDNKTPTKSSNAIKVELNDRSYLIATPSEGFDQQKSYKLILAFHGSNQLAEDLQEMVTLEAPSKNYIVVYPQSKVEEWNEGCDCNKPHRLGIDDLTFVENVVADVSKKYNIINKELYAVGFSQGGLFTQNLMCNSSLKFRAIASIASPMSDHLAQQCQIENNTNYLMVHGKKDKVLPYVGLEHDNFGLIDSESAIRLIAEKNGITNALETEESSTFSKHTYQNNENTSQLIAIEEGEHSWFFTDFNTTNEVVKFFDTASKVKLDSFSSLYRTDKDAIKDVHVRTMGAEHSGPAVVLLSGFNKNFHSDSALFALLQPLIAKSYRVHAIERYGNGFSTHVDEPSYASFAPALEQTLNMLKEEEIIIVSFASANILAHTWQNLPDRSENQLKGMVWIDPDILLPHSIAFYQDWPVGWYRDVAEDLLPHIQAGNWTSRAVNKMETERSDVQALIPLQYSEDMDWHYYDLISQDRVSIEKQLVRAKEIINYHDDLESVRELVISTEAPITVIDTDFESEDIANADLDYVDVLTLWQQEGSQWSQLISEEAGGEYIPLTNSVHMAIFQHPDEILSAIANLATSE